MNTELIEDWVDILPLYPRTRIVRDGSADAAPDFVWQTLHWIARAIDGTEYPAFSLTYKWMGERPDVANYNAFAGRAHVPDDADTGLMKGHIWINQWGCEPEAESKYTATLLHEYIHLHVDRHFGRQGHNRTFYRHLYRFAQRGIVRGLSVLEQWRGECRPIDRKARITLRLPPPSSGWRTPSTLSGRESSASAEPQPRFRRNREGIMVVPTGRMAIVPPLMVSSRGAPRRVDASPGLIGRIGVQEKE